MITQENFDVVSEHLIACLANPGGVHLFPASAFGDEAMLDEVYMAFKDAGYDPEYHVGSVKVVL
jgi:hypothetical protein